MARQRQKPRIPRVLLLLLIAAGLGLLLWQFETESDDRHWQEFSEAGTRALERGNYGWAEKMYSESKGADIYFPKEIRIYDEIEKGNRSTILIQKVDLSPLEKNIFTKAWLESKSR